ncbi:MAG: DUF4080 domain-containing protein [Azonexus sp.]|nr:DUF4080 domain-containing protein [Azonexus sp.]
MPGAESPAKPAIILATLNARYIHASLGLRYLLANMGDLSASTALCEFTIARPAAEIVDSLLDTLGEPGETMQIIGFGVYIWNVTQSLAVLQLLKARRPQLKVVLGGPEVSHEVDTQAITQLADHVITGWGDLSFPELCRKLRDGGPAPARVIAGRQPALAEIALPYAGYSDQDLAQRLIYVEASRGCPFKCEFCLSALDKTAWAFPLDTFLAAMAELYARGARTFKFVDRTFNLNTAVSSRILQFFLDRLAEAPESPVFAHFELIPDHLPEALKTLIVQFPPGTLQFEIGIQTFNPEVQQRISRRQDNAQSEANLRWLLDHSQAHLHTDLIFGLPGETLKSFAEGFDRLYALKPHEIQLGILKRLRGTPIDRHSLSFGMVYAKAPPYTIRQTGSIDAATVERFTRFARYWDLIANSGRFPQTLALLLTTPCGDAQLPPVFARFLALTDWLHRTLESTHRLSPEQLVDTLYRYLTDCLGLTEAHARDTLRVDYLASGARGSPACLRGSLPYRPPLSRKQASLTQRQAQHGSPS